MWGRKIVKCIETMNIRVYFIPLLAFILTVIAIHAKKKYQIQKASLQLLEKETKKLKLEECYSTQEQSIIKLRLTRQTQKALTCIVKSLNDDPYNGWMWSELGTLYTLTKDKTKATTCLKQAVKSSGKLSEYIRTWHFIGPFIIGKAEVDGDPIAYFGGIQNVSRRRYDKKVRFYSELVGGGEVKWKTYEQKGEAEPVQISPDVRWNELISSIGSLAITEWQGWAVGEFAVNSKDENVLVQCHGVSHIFVDDVIITGDVYRRTEYWFGIHLSPGIHTLYVPLRSKGPMTFQCRLKLEGSHAFQVHRPSMQPDLVNGHILGDVLALPITNLQTKKWLKKVKVSISQQNTGIPIKLIQGPIVNIAPGQTMPVKFQFKESESGNDQSRECKEISFILTVSTAETDSDHVTINLRCRHLHQSFIFTFQDHDGSIQQAAAISPTKDCPQEVCPVVLTLHGTGVSAQNQADGYKRMENGDWIFGLDSAWVLAPTRHGAHNWEGPGTLTAMTALHKLQELTKKSPWLRNKADENHVIFAGHSMGGHGAWHLATHYPDRALAVIPLAGWNKKEEYGDSNVFFRHDVSTSHVDPATKAILEACIAENEADRHVSNLQGIPVLGRIGANDRTVHPFFLRRMYRRLKEENVNVTYKELPGKEHWWWDTWKTNDGGAVNDPQLRNFMSEYSLVSSTTDQSCDSVDQDCSIIKSKGKYSKSKLDGSSFTLTVINPALGESLKGVRIIQQIVPYRTSTVQINLTPDSVTLATSNVAKLSISDTPHGDLTWTGVPCEIDGQVVNLKGNPVDLCRKTGSWKSCDDNPLMGNDKERGPSNYGPARRVAERSFLIVTGTSNKALAPILFQLAIYIANLFFLTSDTIAPIIEDTMLTDQLAESNNLIIIGGPGENLHSVKYLDKIPINIDNDSGIQLGECIFKKTRVGLLALAPHGNQGLSLILLGNSLGGLRDVVSLASPTIPPMTRSPFSNMVPDFVITGPDFNKKGAGGYLCSGFWGNRWEYRLELASCAC
ncbi:uncharacterized secreted protein ARB_06907-like [Anneissia japonica]|uniref:uncharacterized secreted protein ARB_06907-like n=1 Tax=Anneissia japonica TaxID=1529436 RepID=UPI0014258DC6|nr:uncharacterized secreted protein ARB_06907-like [Anneissia japonica]